MLRSLSKFRKFCRFYAFATSCLFLANFGLYEKCFKWSFCTAVCSSSPIFFIRQKVLYIIKKKFENRKDIPFPLEKVKNKPSLFLKNARNKEKQELMFFSLAVREISTKTLLEKMDADITFTYCYRGRQ